jgi:hypothetical protein
MRKQSRTHHDHLRTAAASCCCACMALGAAAAAGAREVERVVRPRLALERAVLQLLAQLRQELAQHRDGHVAVGDLCC